MAVCISLKYIELFSTVQDGHTTYIKQHVFSLFKTRKLILTSNEILVDHITKFLIRINYLIFMRTHLSLGWIIQFSIKFDALLAVFI